MKYTLAFDVYGTLIDTAAVLNSLEKLIGKETATPFMNTWRDKQLEYSYRRGLMDKYIDFSICTQNALDYACIKFHIDLSDKQKGALLDEYKTLPAFDDVAEGLETLKKAGHRLFAFSNGSEEAVTKLLSTANILNYFEGVVSVENVKMFKPSPIVYTYFLATAKAKKEESWLISSNNFDVIGAKMYGMNSAWVQRSPDSIFDPWGVAPTAIVHKLTALVKKL
ncbi:haloacid dehalogenase type II [Cellulophaga sp. E16_2]|uniref:Haloacid dehalogenase, type II n=1 Tax=Cellulophaga algicola (strain DSM 14237 / IC166 / ACAM 630) TaxID=688270 RepID=E6X9T8_CELAD|nr:MULTISPECIES: haloacid dehalogenase type II [Cellulophaga]ADV49858.1 haloacid dehalogenase, type II [Cellulophaga algicola DSM 14237]MBO0592241.1 haloacid dehalogenase type II [Cellulophaga sp. E16_2]